MQRVLLCSLSGVLALAACAETVPYAQQVQISSHSHVHVSQGYTPSLAQLPDVPSVPRAPGEQVTSEQIRSALDGYGAWQEDETYGPVWFPSEQAVGSGFVPYVTAGQWIPTEAGAYWSSTYPFGWLVFHYGRWVRRDDRWGWVPGRAFAPAWVEWRSNSEVAGWIPLPPNGAPMYGVYSFCSANMLWRSGIAGYVTYAPTSSGLYGATAVHPARPGVGGVSYSWGPPRATPAPTGGSGPRGNSAGAGIPWPELVPIAGAWSSDAQPRAGAPVATPAPTDEMPRGRAGIVLQAGGEGARVAEAYGRPLGPRSITISDPAPEEGSGPSGSYSGIPTRMEFSSAPPRLRETVSLGTIDPVVPSAPTPMEWSSAGRVPIERLTPSGSAAIERGSAPAPVQPPAPTAVRESWGNSSSGATQMTAPMYVPPRAATYAARPAPVAPMAPMMQSSEFSNASVYNRPAPMAPMAPSAPVVARPATTVPVVTAPMAPAVPAMVAPAPTPSWSGSSSATVRRFW